LVFDKSSQKCPSLKAKIAAQTRSEPIVVRQSMSVAVISSRLGRTYGMVRPFFRT
jgi:hypothetical protein